MAVVVRLARHGAKKRPFYRMVVADSRFPKEGRFIESLGTYDPSHDPAVVKFDQERLQYWHSQGARLTPTVQNICKVSEQPEPKKATKKKKSTKASK